MIDVNHAVNCVNLELIYVNHVVNCVSLELFYVNHAVNCVNTEMNTATKWECLGQYYVDFSFLIVEFRYSTKSERIRKQGLKEKEKYCKQTSVYVEIVLLCTPT